MERSKHTLWFWILVLAAVILPTTTETRSKQLYQAKIVNGGSGVGSSVIQFTQAGVVTYLARTFTLPNGAVTKVSLVADGATWEVVLCENGGLAGDCTYDGTGNLDIDGALNATMFNLAGISGGTFVNALRNGQLWIRLDDGADGSGNYVRIL
jgi:hypothetical protein